MIKKLSSVPGILKSTFDWLIVSYRKNKSLKAQMRAIISSVPGSIYWKDKKGRYLGCNPFGLLMLGLRDENELIGKTDYDLFSKKEADLFRENDLKIMNLDRAIQIEESVVKPDGGKLIQLSYKCPLRDYNGKIFGIVGNTLDITEKKELEKQLAESKANEARFKTLSSVGGMVAHELHTPLATIANNAKGVKKFLPQLLEGYKKAVESKIIVNPLRSDLMNAIEESADMINQAVSCSQATIATILSGLHYSNTSQPSHSMVVFSLKNCVNEALKQYPLVEQRQLIKLNDIGSVTVSGEEQILIHVIHNLLKNSLDSILSAGKGKITISSANYEDRVELIFFDTGKGIESEHLPHIFEPFYTTKKEVTQSVGLGLYFCRMALQTIHATINCDSQWGKYARFTITFNK